MKPGDRVKVIKLSFDDIGIEIGAMGKIKSEFPDNDGKSESDVFEVLFEDLKINEDNPNLNQDGTYDMWRLQLEVIDKEESH